MENATVQTQEKAGKGFTFFYATSVNGTPMLIASIITNNCSKVITEKSRPQGTALIIPPAQAAI